MRSVRLDGPVAGDAAFAALAGSGCLDHVETLCLASDGFSARAVSTALTLPALATLRLDGVSAPGLVVRPAGGLRALELHRCPPETCAAVLRAAGPLTTVDIDCTELPREHRTVWEILAGHGLASLRVAGGRALPAPFAHALRGSVSTLESLTLDGVAGTDGFLAGRSWPRLRALRWHRSEIGELGAHLPGTLTTLSLRGSRVAGPHLDEAWASNLTSAGTPGTRLPGSRRPVAHARVAPAVGTALDSGRLRGFAGFAGFAASRRRQWGRGGVRQPRRCS